MNKYFLISFLLLLTVSCKQEAKSKEYIDAPIDHKVPVETEMEPEVSIEKNLPSGVLSYLFEYEGKYATQEKIFTQIPLSKRLQVLPRFNYDAFLANYNTETTIIIESNIIHMSGCKQHNCPSNAYDIFIDVENDNINIYHFRTNMLRIYNEKGTIDLPTAFKEEMEIKKTNAGIGNPDSLESNYEL